MSDRDQIRETEKVVRRVMKTAEKFDRIGKEQFEIILDKVIHQARKNSKADQDEIEALTPQVIEDMPREYGRLNAEQRSTESLIAYLYNKYLQELGLLK
jgi:hypothetical protein